MALLFSSFHHLIEKDKTKNFLRVYSLFVFRRNDILLRIFFNISEMLYNLTWKFLSIYLQVCFIYPLHFSIHIYLCFACLVFVRSTNDLSYNTNHPTCFGLLFLSIVQYRTVYSRLEFTRSTTITHVVWSKQNRYLHSLGCLQRPIVRGVVSLILRQYFVRDIFAGDLFICRFWYRWKGPSPNPDVVAYMEKNYPADWTYADFANQFRADLFSRCYLEDFHIHFKNDLLH